MPEPSQDNEPIAEEFSPPASPYSWESRAQNTTASIDPLHRDQMGIDTPELVEIRFALAGLGSRFLAILVDMIVQYLTYMVLSIIFVIVIAAGAGSGGSKVAQASRFSDSGEKWLIAAVIFIIFLMHWAYFALFEGLWHGQTPGKRLLKLRVIKDSGRQITLMEAMARNLLRVIDALPGMYLVGCISILLTRRNKRLGDLLADTLVIHERAEDAAPIVSGSRTITHGVFAPPLEIAADYSADAVLPADAIARLTDADLNVIETFFTRNLDFAPEVRARIAEKLLRTMEARCGLPLQTVPIRSERWKPWRVVSARIA